MQKSLIPYMKRLRNHEFAEAYSLVCKRLVVGESTSENITQAVTEVDSYSSELKFLRNMRGQHPHTKNIRALREKRHQYFLSLRGQISYLARSPIAEEKESAQLLQIWLQRYHEFFKRRSIHAQSRLLANISEEIASSAEIARALSNLNLIPIITSIEVATEDIIDLNQERKDDTKAAAVKAKQIRDTACFKLETLWKALEVSLALRSGSAAESNSLMEGINLAISDFKALYLSKTTRRENQKLEDELDSEPEADQPDEPEDEPEAEPEGEDDTPTSEPTPEQV